MKSAVLTPIPKAGTPRRAGIIESRAQRSRAANYGLRRLPRPASTAWLPSGSGYGELLVALWIEQHHSVPVQLPASGGRMTKRQPAFIR